MISRVVALCKGQPTCEALTSQLRNILGSRAIVEGIYLDAGIDSTIEADLVVISSQWIEERALEHVRSGTRCLVSRRTISSHALERLFALPAGTRALLVNDIASTARETVDSLSELGLGHLELVPYAPGMPVPAGLTLAVTPGETALVPPGIETIIDIGVRVLDMTTIVEICSALGILDEKAYLLSARYMRELVHLYRKVFQEAARTTKVKNELAAIVRTSHDGIVAVDEEGHITVFNPAAEIIFEKPEPEVLGRPAKEVGLEGIVGRVIETGTAEENDLVVLRDRTLVVNRLPIHNGAGHTAGAVATVKDITEIQEMEQELRQKLRGKGYYAPHTFENITSRSPAMRQTLGIARRIAQTHSTVLITGESGTGKELLAQAIHNYSPRRGGPFVAINIASMPESLLESELFGYEEGAFTGARKGGSPGLFEEAHRGTIFLDEIGDAPLSLQARLLRVVQEKQVRRVGGTRVMPVDIRVVAATNRDLMALVRQGRFREDLYYRLKVLTVDLPPLRERKEDVMLLARRFIGEFCRQLRKKLTLSPQVEDELVACAWPGNVRELRNLMEYLAIVADAEVISPTLLPETYRRHGTTDEADRIRKALVSFAPETEVTWVLTEIAAAKQGGVPVGRRSLALKAGRALPSLTEYRARALLDQLREHKLVTAGKGVKGTEMTQLGLQVYEAFSAKGMNGR